MQGNTNLAGYHDTIHVRALLSLPYWYVSNVGWQGNGNLLPGPFMKEDNAHKAFLSFLYFFSGRSNIHCATGNREGKGNKQNRPPPLHHCAWRGGGFRRHGIGMPHKGMPATPNENSHTTTNPNPCFKNVGGISFVGSHRMPYSLLFL